MKSRQIGLNEQNAIRITERFSMTFLGIATTPLMSVVEIQLLVAMTEHGWQ